MKSPIDRPARPSPRELDTLLEALRASLVHHLASDSPDSAASGRRILDRLAMLLDGGSRAAACGGGNTEHQPALAELLAILSRQAIATTHAEARDIARRLEALGHSADTGLGPVLRKEIVRLAEEWRLRERRAGDMENERRC